MRTKKRSMPITDVVSRWMREEGWDDEIKIDLSAKTSTVSTHLEIEGYTCSTYIEVDERDRFVAMFIYARFRFPAKRHVDACVLANEVNARIGHGRVVIQSDKSAQFRIAEALQESDPSTKLLRSLIGGGVASFAPWISAFEGLALTKLTPKQLVKRVEGKSGKKT